MEGNLLGGSSGEFLHSEEHEATKYIILISRKRQSVKVEVEFGHSYKKKKRVNQKVVIIKQRRQVI